MYFWISLRNYQLTYSNLEMSMERQNNRQILSFFCLWFSLSFSWRSELFKRMLVDFHHHFVIAVCYLIGCGVFFSIIKTLLWVFEPNSGWLLPSFSYCCELLTYCWLQSSCWWHSNFLLLANGILIDKFHRIRKRFFDWKKKPTVVFWATRSRKPQRAIHNFIGSSFFKEFPLLGDIMKGSPTPFNSFVYQTARRDR